MLHEKLKKMMAEKKSMPANEKEAKMNVVKHLHDMASSAMKDKMGAVHKVSVASNSPEGLKAGLDTAKDAVSQDSDNDGDANSDTDMDGMAHGGEVDGNKPEHNSLDELDQMVHDASNSEHDALSAHDEHESDQDHESTESPEVEAAEHDSDDDMGEDELNAKLEKLMKLKNKKDSKKSNNPY